MTADPAILVVSDANDDASLVANLLRPEFAQVATAGSRELLAAFDAPRPCVLVLAFDALERAVACLDDLHRDSATAHRRPLRSIALCQQGELEAAYALCRDGRVDDYVPFWPQNHDPHRLPMAVRHAVRALSAGTSPEHAAGLATLAAAGAEAERRLTQAREEIEAGLQEMTDAAPAAGDGNEADAWKQALARLRSRAIEPPLQAAAEAMAPLRQLGEDLQARQAAAPATDGADASGAAGAGAPGGRSRVLLVDDDAFQRRLLVRMMAELPIDVSEAQSATHGFSLLRNQAKPDLILLDLKLPDIDGIEFTKRVKAMPAWAAIPIVMVTGNSDREAVVQCVKAGASGFVVKPVAADALMRHLRQHLPLGGPAGG